MPIFLYRPSHNDFRQMETSNSQAKLDNLNTYLNNKHRKDQNNEKNDIRISIL